MNVEAGGLKMVRVGRTARAGRNGTAYTLLKPGQMGSYQALMKLITHGDVRVHPSNDDEILKQLYIQSLPSICIYYC